MTWLVLIFGIITPIVALSFMIWGYRRDNDTLARIAIAAGYIFAAWTAYHSTTRDTRVGALWDLGIATIWIACIDRWRSNLRTRIRPRRIREQNDHVMDWFNDVGRRP